MRNRFSIVPSALGLALSACVVGAPATDTSSPRGSSNQVSSEPILFYVDGSLWAVEVPGGTYSQPDSSTHRVATGAFSLQLAEWPRSHAFVQTLAQHVQSERERDPAVAILHQADGGEGNFEAVLEVLGKTEGTVVRPGHGTGVMCSFDLAGGDDWRDALAACQTLRPATPEEIASEEVGD